MLDLKFTNSAIHLSPRRFNAGRTQLAMMSSSYSFSSSIRFSSCFKMPVFDYEDEHADDDEYE